MRVVLEENVCTNLDLVLSIKLVVVKSVFSNPSAAFVHVFHERDVFFCWNKPNLVEVWVPEEVNNGRPTRKRFTY
jgi:hypothetical protein